MRKTAFDWNTATPWIGSAVGGLGLGALGYLLAPKKYKKLFGALGLLGGAAGGYYGGSKLQSHVNTKRDEAQPAAALQTPSGRAAYADWLRANTNLTDQQIAHVMNTGDTSMLSDYRPTYAGSIGTRALMSGLSNMDSPGSRALDFVPGFWGYTLTDKIADKLDVMGKLDPNNKLNPIARIALDTTGRITAGGVTQWGLNRGGAAIAEKFAPKLALGPLASRINAGAGYLSLGLNTANDVKNAWTGKTYMDDAAEMQAMGPNMSPFQAFLTAGVKNLVRTGGKTAGAALTLKGHPIAGSILGGSLPIDHPIAMIKNNATSISNLFSERGRRQEVNYWRFLGSHFKGNDPITGTMRLMSSGYFEGDQDREAAKVLSEINARGDAIAQRLTGVDAKIAQQYPDIAAKKAKGTWSDAEKSFWLSQRRANGIDANKMLF